MKYCISKTEYLENSISKETNVMAYFAWNNWIRQFQGIRNLFTCYEQLRIDPVAIVKKCAFYCKNYKYSINLDSFPTNNIYQ